MDSIHLEVIMIELLADSIESCDMKLPGRVVLLEFIVQSRTIDIIHRDDRQVHLLCQITILVIGQELSEQHECLVGARNLIRMMSADDEFCLMSCDPLGS